MPWGDGTSTVTPAAQITRFSTQQPRGTVPREAELAEHRVEFGRRRRLADFHRRPRGNLTNSSPATPPLMCGMVRRGRVRVGSRQVSAARHGLRSNG
jgi:hypothetical protein